MDNGTNTTEPTRRMLASALAELWSHAGLKATAEDDGANIWVVNFGHPDLRECWIEVHSRKDLRLMHSTGLEIHFRVWAYGPAKAYVGLEIDCVMGEGYDPASLAEAASLLQRLAESINPGPMVPPALKACPCD